MVLVFISTLFNLKTDLFLIIGSETRHIPGEYEQSPSSVITNHSIFI